MYIWYIIIMHFHLCMKIIEFIHFISDVVHWLLLQVVVIYSFHTLSIIILFFLFVMNHWFRKNMFYNHFQSYNTIWFCTPPPPSIFEVRHFPWFPYLFRSFPSVRFVLPFFSMVHGDTIETPFLLSKTFCNSFIF